MSEAEGVTEGVAEAGEERDFVVAEDAQPERPEWLPEKYKTGEDLAKGYQELQAKFGQKEETLRESIMEEIQREAFSDRPETQGDYQLPEYVDEVAAVDSELLSWWSEHSFENGFSQAEFEKGIEMYAKAMGNAQPDLEAEAKKLGENATNRIESANMFANKFFPEETLPAIARLCESHEGIIALETIMEALKDGNYGGDTAPPSSVNEDSLREMMRDERYWNPVSRDNGFVKQVESGFKKLYG